MIFENANFPVEPPYYVSKEDFFSASEDCLSYKYIETDNFKIKSMIQSILKIDTDLSHREEGELDKGTIYGFIETTKEEVYIFFKNGEVQIYQYKKKSDHENGIVCRGQILSIEPLLTQTDGAFYSVYGFLSQGGGLTDIEVCSPDQNPWDDSPERPYIRNKLK